MAKQPQTIKEFKVSVSDRNVAPRNFGDVSAFLGRMGNSLGAVESRINAGLDRQAVSEGSAAGLEAGQQDDLKLMKDTTLRGRAFNSMALKTYAGRTEVKILGEMTTAFSVNKDNPEALSAAYEEIRKDNLAGAPVPAVPGINNLIDKQMIVGLEASSRIMQGNVQSAAKATAADQLTAQSRSIEQMAFTLDEGERGSAMVLDSVAAFQQTLISYGPRGEFEFGGVTFPPDVERGAIYQPADMQRMMQQMEDGIVTNKAFGKFDRAPGIASKMAVRDSIRPAWEKGEFDLSESAVTSLENRMDADIRALRVENNAGNRALINKVDAINRAVEKGFAIQPEDWNAIQAEVAANGDPVLAETLEATKNLSLFQNAIIQSDPAELQLIINEQRNQIIERGGIEDFEEIRRLELSENLLTEMKTELNRDPISWGVRVGLVDNEPIQLTGDAAFDSMDRRRAQGLSLSDKYGIAPKFLTDEEVSTLSAQLPDMTVDERLGLANTLNTGFQDDAPTVLGRISDDNTSFAHVAGLMHEGSRGNVDVARNILEGNLARVGQKINILPSKIDLDQGYVGTAGASLGVATQMRVNVIEAAKDIYTSKGLRIGLTSDEFEEELWDKSLNEAAGAVFVDGIQYGGFGEFNGQKIVLPKGMMQEDFDLRMGSVSDAKIEAGIFGDIPRHADGTVVTAEEIEDGFLVSVGDGLYNISLEEDGSEFLIGSDPQRAFTFTAQDLRIDQSDDEVFKKLNPFTASALRQGGF